MQKTAARLAAAIAIAATANPCLAQSQIGFGQRDGQAPAAFAGVNLRLELGARGRPTPVARLAVGPIYGAHRGGEVSGQTRSAVRGFELGLSRWGRAELHVSGQPVSRVTERLGADGRGMSPVWIVGGVVLLAVGVLVISNLNSLSDNQPAN